MDRDRLARRGDEPRRGGAAHVQRRGGRANSRGGRGRDGRSGSPFAGVCSPPFAPDPRATDPPGAFSAAATLSATADATAASMLLAHIASARAIARASAAVDANEPAPSAERHSPMLRFRVHTARSQSATAWRASSSCAIAARLMRLFVAMADALTPPRARGVSHSRARPSPIQIKIFARPDRLERGFGEASRHCGGAPSCMLSGTLPRPTIHLAPPRAHLRGDTRSTRAAGARSPTTMVRPRDPPPRAPTPPATRSAPFFPTRPGADGR